MSFWWLLLLVPVLLVADLWRRREQAAFLDLLQRLRARRGGDLRPGSLLAHPSLTLAEGAHRLRLSAMPGGGTEGPRGPITFADTALPARAHEGFRLLTRERSAQQAIDARLTSNAVGLGDPGFDARFVITSPTPALVRQLFRADLRSFLVGLPHRLDVQLNRGRLTVACAGLATSETVLDDLLETARRLLRALDDTAPGAVTHR